MQEFEFDPETGELIEASKAASPLANQGRLSDLAYSTQIVPPEAGKNEKAVYAGDTWELKPDFRGGRYYQRKAEGLIKCTVIRKPGEKVPADAYVRFEDVPLTQAEKRERLSAEVAALLHRVSGQPEYDYMSIADAKSHVKSLQPGQALQAQAFVLWEAACWNVYLSMTSDIENLPSALELINLMPEFAVPFVLPG